MFTKEITYTDYKGVERTETHHFNLTKTELAIMNNSVDGGIYDRLLTMIKSKKTPEIMKAFCEIISKAYGRLSEDGRRLEKSDAIFADFEQTPAYDQFFMEIINNEDSMAAFIKGVLPYDLVKDSDIGSIPSIKEIESIGSGSGKKA